MRKKQTQFSIIIVSMVYDIHIFILDIFFYEYITFFRIKIKVEFALYTVQF